MLEIYNYLCEPALELKLFTKKKLEGSTPKIMLSMHVLPPTTEKVMHVMFLFSDSADFILIDFRLLDYL